MIESVKSLSGCYNAKRMKMLVLIQFTCLSAQHAEKLIQILKEKEPYKNVVEDADVDEPVELLRNVVGQQKDSTSTVEKKEFVQEKQRVLFEEFDDLKANDPRYDDLW